MLLVLLLVVQQVNRPSIYCRARRVLQDGWYEWSKAAVHRTGLYTDFQVTTTTTTTTTTTFSIQTFNILQSSASVSRWLIWMIKGRSAS